MLVKFRKLNQFFLNLKTIFSLYNNGYLKDMGFFESVKKKDPIDKNGNPIPWITYPAIEFLETRLNKSMDVSEYGCGNSTLWLAERVKSVLSIEHDKNWFDKVNNIKPNNVKLILKELNNGDYSKEILNYHNNFDIILIDGRDRVRCVKNSINALKVNGVIVCDDSDRKDYEKGYAFLKRNRFQRIDFWGTGAIVSIKFCTSIFYRKENCLGL
jgi:hypothetical protein